MNDNAILNKINSQPWYYKNSICDECASIGDMTKKYVKRVQDDGICFCHKHWKDYENSSLELGEFIEPFYPN